VRAGRISAREALSQATGVYFPDPALATAGIHFAKVLRALDLYEALESRLREWFGRYEGPIGYEVRDLRIAAGDDIAFAHFLYHVTGRMTNGNEVDMWVRSTMGLQKGDGVWAITHEHNSVPFDAESGKASLDLAP